MIYARGLEQPQFKSRISYSEVKSCGTIRPRKFWLPSSFLGPGDWLQIVMLHCNNGGRGRKVFRQVPRSWTSKTSAYLPCATRADRRGCFFFFFFSHCRFSIPGCVV